MNKPTYEELEQIILKQSKQIDTLTQCPSVSKGMKGEILISSILNGKLTKYSESFDVLVNNVKIEVKASKLNNYKKTHNRKRWNWSRCLNSNNVKSYDYLILVGDTDIRYLDQYLDDTGYVYFLIPSDKVDSVCSSNGSINLIGDLSKVRSENGNKLINNFMVNLDQIKTFI